MKTEILRVRLTEQEKNLLQERATKLQMSMSDYVKYCCLQNPPSLRDMGFKKLDEMTTEEYLKILELERFEREQG